MGIHVALHHRTEYRYDRLVGVGPQVVRLRPTPHSRTPILAYSLKAEPAQHFINWQQDPQANYLARFVFPERTDRLCFTVDLIADMAVINPFDFFLEPAAETCPFEYDHVLDEELAPFRRAAEPGPLLQRYLDGVDRRPRRTIDFLVELNQRVQRDVGYIVRLEPGVQTPEETLAKREGSCRDSGWLLVQMLRHLGLAARFVSGYLIQLVADEKPLDGPVGPIADFTDLHAWCEVYLPGAGWIGLDPTSGLMAGEGHIPLACSPEPGSAAPITGSIEKAKSTLDFRMSVTRIDEAPRITRPYSDAKWQGLLALGRKVDADIAAADMRLTMGGEPTFVAADDPDGAEWTTHALGPTKRRYAGRLLRRLADRFAGGYLLHYGQGKWYPGEQLPRWALGCHWRRDGEPVWRDKRLFASDEDTNGRLTHDDARGFISQLAERLQVDPAFCTAGYEDAWYYLWKERRLPVNVDPLKSELHDPLERERLARVFEQGLDAIVGYALPLARAGTNGQRYWRSGRWFFRSDTMFLIPGDSPMGYRLPLDSLPWVQESDYPYVYPTDPMAPRGGLPPRQAFQAPRGEPRNGVRPNAAPQGRREQAPLKPLQGWSASDVVRTALCAEVRNGLLHLFMPPVEMAEDYLDLLAAVEDVAGDRGEKVILEGYPPPFDPRLNHFSVTPDPGVIEVNVHPADSWDELVRNTTTVYEEARATRLVTEKFMLDGRHVGTGGGNHIVIGGSTPADSPLLRRPDLLRSLVGYWHNHPSLSYLFSGLFIGATSQHPRVDEGRDDATYQLELAFKALERAETPPPWLVDRALRDVLVDVTGNTHRAEFCIDKLYSPDGAAGRRGLLELRAFEMPPHARMSLAQQLLLRALLATFWRQPYDRRLMRYGTRLHDEFMLPYFVANDFADVLDDLRRAGYALDPQWFAAHHEFRFPLIGQAAYRGIEIELRHALEPWNVLGEDAGAGGTVRYVDSSVERMQVKLSGATEERHVLVCNGRTVPLRATGRRGEYVAGLRYRAWQPPRALHPTIPVDAPLVFDLFDTWNGRAVGGCTYHVAHPGGRNFDRFPVNANEAETRRRARFFAIGHTPASYEARIAVPAGEHPVTLDLRHAT
ncbi:MAG: transglutaminase family protein [Alphaproteobacteria bacterium]|nr:transglutaminase family protein [Alphaproteobacteria bacterium]